MDGSRQDGPCNSLFSNAAPVACLHPACIPLAPPCSTTDLSPAVRHNLWCTSECTTPRRDAAHCHVTITLPRRAAGSCVKAWWVVTFPHPQGGGHLTVTLLNTPREPHHTTPHHTTRHHTTQASQHPLYSQGLAAVRSRPGGCCGGRRWSSRETHQHPHSVAGVVGGLRAPEWTGRSLVQRRASTRGWVLAGPALRSSHSSK